MTWQRITFVIAVLVILIVAWLGRYEIIGVPAGGEGTHGIAYRLDRWTGQVVFIQGSRVGVTRIK